MEIKYPPPVSKNWSLLEFADIPSTTVPKTVYLRRLRLLQTPWFAFYLHWINEPDGQHPHDHPWNFWSFILRGGYSEQIWDRPDSTRRGIRGSTPSYLRRWNRFTFHKMYSDKVHLITRVDPRLVTLVFVGRRVRDWGFWTPEGWVYYRDYRKAQGAVEDEFA